MERIIDVAQYIYDEYKRQSKEVIARRDETAQVALSFPERESCNYK